MSNQIQHEPGCMWHAGEECTHLCAIPNGGEKPLPKLAMQDYQYFASVVREMGKVVWNPGTFTLERGALRGFQSAALHVVHLVQDLIEERKARTPLTTPTVVLDTLTSEMATEFQQLLESELFALRVIESDVPGLGAHPGYLETRAAKIARHKDAIRRYQSYLDRLTTLSRPDRDGERQAVFEFLIWGSRNRVVIRQGGASITMRELLDQFCAARALAPGGTDG